MLRILLMSTILIVSLQALPKEIEADKYLLLAKQNMKDKNYQEAQENFEKILSLGVKIPNTLHYYYAKTLYENREFNKTLSELDIFLTNGGKEDKHYVEALKLYTNTENEMANEVQYADYVVEDNGLLFLALKEDIQGNYKSITWKQAKSYCKNLNLFGKGWRLPTIKEVKQMTNDDVLNGAVETSKMSYNESRKLYRNWHKKHDLERIKGPDCEYVKKSWDNDDRCYVHIKEKFTKNIKENDIRDFYAGTIGTWTNERFREDGINYAYVIRFISNIIGIEEVESSSYTVCVKEK